MRSNIIAPEDWASVRGSATLDLVDGPSRRVEIDLISEGAALFAYIPRGEDGELERLLLWCGRGTARVVLAVTGKVVLGLEQDAERVTSVRVPEARSLDVAWRNTPSFTDLDPPKPFTVSPEMEAMIQRMNANAVRREMMLLQALDARLKAERQA